MTPSGARVVIIGAGIAGCVLAGRLSQNPSLDVLLFEEGHWLHRPDLTRQPPKITSLRDAFNPAVSRHWAAMTGSGQNTELLGGRVVGGSGRINGGYFIRPTTADLTSWSNKVGASFDVTAFNSAMRSAENDLDFGDSPLHSSTGPLPVSRDYRDLHPISEAFQAAALEANFDSHPDLNDGRADGIGPVPFNTDGGLRADPSIRYLWPAMRRRNLTLLSGVQVARVVIKNTRAIGLEIHSHNRSNSPVFVGADLVILAAGTIGTPSILLPSGVGPAKDLTKAGVRVEADLCAVGEQFRNHRCIDVPYLPALESAQTEAMSFMQLALHLDVSAGHKANTEFLATCLPYGKVTTIDPADEHLSVRVTDMTDGPAGSIRLIPGPEVGTRVTYPLHGDDAIRAGLRGAVRQAVALMRSDSFRPVIEKWAGPTTRVLRSNQLLDEWIGDRLGTAYHMIGSCPMGQNPSGSVVDAGFGVHGIESLYVVDASVIPVQLSRGPAASVVALAEMAAQEVNKSVGS